VCGVILVSGKNAKKQANECLVRIKHRGTKSPNIKTIHKQLSIGFVRLPINDSSENADQPFTFQNLIGVFNCEIYNHAELTEKYQLRSNLKSTSDAEIILPLFERFRKHSNYPYKKLFTELDGFFSGIIYDKQKKKIYCIKDYIGKKPLFVVYKKGTFIITSELKAADCIDRFEVVPKGISVIENQSIKQLYKFDYHFGVNKALKSVLYQAVKKRIPLKKDQPQFGVFLSGGIDSSIIALLTLRIIEKNSTFSRPVFYCLDTSNEKQNIDRQFIEELVEYLNIKKYFKMVTFDKSKLKENLEKTIYHTESYNPSIVSNGIAYYLLTAQAKKDGIKVVLSGDGADEMFLGYKVYLEKDYKNSWFNILSDLHFTELRRVDLISMANSVEIRCPFLDKSVYQYAVNLHYTDFYGIGKSIIKYQLKKSYNNKLPSSIINRNKTPLDVGSGIQKEVLTLSDPKHRGVLSEKQYFKEIWLKLFPNREEIVDEMYFHQYPAFKSFIQSRWNKYLDEQHKNAT